MNKVDFEKVEQEASLDVKKIVSSCRNDAAAHNIVVSPGTITAAAFVALRVSIAVLRAYDRQRGL